MKKNEIEIWTKDLVNNEMAVGLLNRSGKAQTIRMRWSDLHINDMQKIRDVWTHEKLGTYTDSFEIEVKSHEVVLLVLWPVLE